MDLFTGIIVYLLLWWTFFFAVLPIGTRPVEDPDPAGGWRGTPAKPLMLRKVIGTTVLAAILWLGADALIRSDWISFREGWWAYQGPGVSGPMPGRAQN
jgi:predicted secreted protein